MRTALWRPQGIVAECLRLVVQCRRLRPGQLCCDQSVSTEICTIVDLNNEMLTEVVHHPCYRDVLRRFEIMERWVWTELHLLRAG